MANEIQWRGTETGVTLYATIRSKTGTQWNTAGTPNFEAVTAANWADYDIALAESSGNYFYTGTFPAISGNMVAGWYWVDIYKRAGGTPAITDVLQGTIVGYWDGTSLLPWASDTKAVNGTVQTARDLGADTTAIVADTNELQTDWVNGGRLDLLLDGVKAKTDSLTFTVTGDLDANVQSWAGASVATPSVAGVPEVDLTYVNGVAATGSSTVDANVTTIANGAITAAAIATGAIDADALAADAGTEIGAAVKTAIEAAGSHLTLILEDTGTTLPATLSTISGYLDTEVAAILADTDELQKAITDGGRTDLLIDAIKGKTDLMLDAAAIRTAVGLESANLDTQIATLATAANLATLDTLVDKMAPLLIGTVTGAGTATEVYVYDGVTATVTVDVDGNVSGVVFS